MSTIWIAYWATEKYRGEILERGLNAEDRLCDAIMSGDISGKVECIHAYDVDEGWVCDKTEDCAILLAKRLPTYASVRPDLYDFIEAHAGWEYLRGMHRADLTFAAE